MDGQKQDTTCPKLSGAVHVNAVIILSTQGGMVPTYVGDSLADMEQLFKGYIVRE